MTLPSKGQIIDWADRVSLGPRMLTSRLRMWPRFLIIGVMRGGTTSLYRYVTRHPSVAGAGFWMKEINFFSLHFHRGARWYRAHFPTALFARLRHGREVITGEASPGYLAHPHAPARIRGLLPDVKLIVLLRDPVERAFSHYTMKIAGGVETLGFGEAVEREEERLAGERERMRDDDGYWSEKLHHFSYRSSGVYVELLEPWLVAFPRENLLVLPSERLYADPPRVLREVAGFLGLAPWELASHRTHGHSYRHMSELDPDSRERLAAYYAPHNRRLYERLGVDFGWQ